MTHPADRSAPVPPVEPMHSIDDLARLLNVSRRKVEQMRAAGQFVAPDCYVGKMPRWWPATVRVWMEGQAKQAAPKQTA